MLKCSHVKSFSAIDDIEMNCKIILQRHFFQRQKGEGLYQHRHTKQHLQGHGTE